MHALVLEKVKTWTSGVGVLAEAAKLYPQAAFAALSKSLQFQRSYMQRVVPNCESCFEILCNALNDIFWPALFQGTVSDSEKKLFSLPAHMEDWEFEILYQQLYLPLQIQENVQLI